jgi:hypothetical protein
MTSEQFEELEKLIRKCHKETIDELKKLIDENKKWVEEFDKKEKLK